MEVIKLIFVKWFWVNVKTDRLINTVPQFFSLILACNGSAMCKSKNSGFVVKVLINYLKFYSVVNHTQNEYKGRKLKKHMEIFLHQLLSTLKKSIKTQSILYIHVLLTTNCIILCYKHKINPQIKNVYQTLRVNIFV